MPEGPDVNMRHMGPNHRNIVGDSPRAPAPTSLPPRPGTPPLPTLIRGIKRKHDDCVPEQPKKRRRTSTGRRAHGEDAPLFSLKRKHVEIAFDLQQPSKRNRAGNESDSPEELPPVLKSAMKQTSTRRSSMGPPPVPGNAMQSPTRRVVSMGPPPIPRGRTSAAQTGPLSSLYMQASVMHTAPREPLVAERPPLEDLSSQLPALQTGPIQRPLTPPALIKSSLLQISPEQVSDVQPERSTAQLTTAIYSQQQPSSPVQNGPEQPEAGIALQEQITSGLEPLVELPSQQSTVTHSPEKQYLGQFPGKQPQPENDLSNNATMPTSVSSLQIASEEEAPPVEQTPSELMPSEESSTLGSLPDQSSPGRMSINRVTVDQVEAEETQAEAPPREQTAKATQQPPEQAPASGLSPTQGRKRKGTGKASGKSAKKRCKKAPSHNVVNTGVKKPTMKQFISDARQNQPLYVSRLRSAAGNRGGAALVGLDQKKKLKAQSASGFLW